MDFIVKGMSCASCQAHVEKAVSSIDGVSSCIVSLLTNSMKVEGNVSSNVIIEAVSKAGYSAYVQCSKEERIFQFWWSSVEIHIFRIGNGKDQVEWLRNVQEDLIFMMYV